MSRLQVSFRGSFRRLPLACEVQCGTKLYLKTVLPGTPKFIPLQVKGETIIENNTEDGEYRKMKNYSYGCEEPSFPLVLRPLQKLDGISEAL